MDTTVALIGFGEAGETFAAAGAWEQAARVFDIKTGDPASAEAKHADFAAAGVEGCETLAQAVSGAPLVLSLVTADQALSVAQQAAGLMGAGALFCDLNSVAPSTKCAAAEAIEAAGGRYVDVAVMAPVNPARLNVPLLLSGAQAEEAAEMLAELGFANVRVVGDEVGRASSIKMIRSVMVKGMEALTAECVLAANAAGVLDEVLASLDASEKPRPWGERADYNLDRMLVHGVRRAAEMEEVVKTLEALGTGALLTRGTVARQRALGTLGIAPPPDGLTAKIAAIQTNQNREADPA